MNLQRSITIVSTPATLRSIPGPSLLARYVYVLSLGRLYQWTAGSNLVDDGLAVIVPNTGGFQGAWIYQRSLPNAAAAPVALTNGVDVHINVGLGTFYRLPLATLGANRALYIDATNAAAGDTIEILREDLGAWTYTVNNNGAAPSTIKVLPISVGSELIVYFDGSNWLHRRSALTL